MSIINHLTQGRNMCKAERTTVIIDNSPRQCDFFMPMGLRGTLSAIVQAIGMQRFSSIGARLTLGTKAGNRTNNRGGIITVVETLRHPLPGGVSIIQRIGKATMSDIKQVVQALHQDDENKGFDRKDYEYNFNNLTLSLSKAETVVEMLFETEYVSHNQQLAYALDIIKDNIQAVLKVYSQEIWLQLREIDKLKKAVNDAAL